MARSYFKLLASILVLLFFSTICIAAEEIPLYAKMPKINSVAAAYKAKILCSAVFVSKRDPAVVQNQELKFFPFPARVDYENKTVTVTAGLGMPDLQAVYREGLGCTVGMDFTNEHIRAQITGDPTPYPPNLRKQKLL